MLLDEAVLMRETKEKSDGTKRRRTWRRIIIKKLLDDIRARHTSGDFVAEIRT